MRRLYTTYSVHTVRATNFHLIVVSANHLVLEGHFACLSINWTMDTHIPYVAKCSAVTHIVSPCLCWRFMCVRRTYIIIIIITNVDTESIFIFYPSKKRGTQVFFYILARYAIPWHVVSVCHSYMPGANSEQFHSSFMTSFLFISFSI